MLPIKGYFTGYILHHFFSIHIYNLYRISAFWANRIQRKSFILFCSVVRILMACLFFKFIYRKFQCFSFFYCKNIHIIIPPHIQSVILLYSLPIHKTIKYCHPAIEQIEHKNLRFQSSTCVIVYQ